MRRRKEGERIEGGERERRERLHCWQCDTWRKVMFQWLLWCQHTYQHTQHIDRRGPDRLLCAFVTCYYFGFGFGEQILFTCCRQGIHRAANTPAGFRSVMVRSWAGSRVQLFNPNTNWMIAFKWRTVCVALWKHVFITFSASLSLFVCPG